MATKHITDQDIITWSKQNGKNFYDWMSKNGYSKGDISYAGRRELWNKKFGNTPYQGTEAQNRRLWASLEEKPQYYLPPTNPQTQQLFKQANYNQPQLYQNNNPDIPKKKTWIDKYNEWDDRMMQYRLPQAASKVATVFNNAVNTPQRVLGDIYDDVANINDPNYDETKLLDFQHAATHDTPVLGKKFAENYPMQSALVDIIAPTVAFGAPMAALSAVTKIPSLTRNVTNYAPKAALNWKAYSKNFNNILREKNYSSAFVDNTPPSKVTMPTFYRSIMSNQRNVPVSNNFSSDPSIILLRDKITRQSTPLVSRSKTPILDKSIVEKYGVNNPANKQLSLNNQYIRDFNEKEKFKAQLAENALNNPYTIPSYNTSGNNNIPSYNTSGNNNTKSNNLIWFGIPQIVGNPRQNLQHYNINMESPIVPINMKDSEYIRASGANYGDTVIMPDNRAIKYMPLRTTNNKNYPEVEEEDRFAQLVHNSMDNRRRRAYLQDIPKKPINVKVTPGVNPNIYKPFSR